MIARKIALVAAGATMVASAVFAPAASAKKQPQVLQPSSKWNLDYAESKCRLLRTFGEGDDEVVLIMDQSRPGDVFSMTVAGKPMKDLRLDPRDRAGGITTGGRFQHEPEKVEVRFGPGEESREVSYLKGDLGPYKPALIFSSMNFRGAEPEGNEAGPESGKVVVQAVTPGPIDFLARDISMERTRQIEWLQFDRRGGSIRLATGPMDVPIAGMQTCLEDLAQHWDIDVPAHRALSRLVQTADDGGTWIRPDDYPDSAIRAGEQAILNFRLSVGPNGIPTNCEIVRFTKATEFDEISCKRMLERARFEPALDSQGQAIKSVYFGTIRFVMP